MMREISWLLRIMTVVCIMGVAAGKASQPSSPALVAKNYPKEVHQMFQERLNGRGKTPSLGSWASWSQWSSCSRSCGGGVATQTRECRRRGRGSRRRRSRTDAADNSTLGPGDMKSQCVGVYKRFHICNDQACPVGTKDFRQLQCESFNGKQFMGRVYLWEPFLDAPSRCELNCRAVGFRFYATLNQTVVDGTPCRGDFPGRWVCVSDMCKDSSRPESYYSREVVAVCSVVDGARGLGGSVA